VAKIWVFGGNEGKMRGLMNWKREGKWREFGEIDGKPIVLASNSVGKCQLV